MNDDNLGSTSSAGSDRNNGVAWERATLEKLVFATIREQQAQRRWKMFTRFMWLAFLGAIVWFVYTSANVTSTTSTPHTAVVEIKGEIASGAEASAENVVGQLYDKLHDSHYADDFFAWLATEIRQERLEFNSPTAIAHAHQDGLLLVSPKVFRVYAETCAADWTKVQKAVNQSGYVLQEKHRHVHAYLIKNPRGSVGKSLSCAVVELATCKALLPPLPEANPMILGRS